MTSRSITRFVFASPLFLFRQSRLLHSTSFSDGAGTAKGAHPVANLCAPDRRRTLFRDKRPGSWNVATYHVPGSLNKPASLVLSSPTRNIATSASTSQDASATSDMGPRIKFKRLDKTARHIMQILDKEAVEEVKTNREIPEIKPGYIVQLKVEVPENKRRVSIIKGIVIARRNAGLNSTFRLRRLVAGVGIESLFPLYSPNIKEIKVLDKKKVRRAKLYYLRDKMNALKKH